MFYWFDYEGIDAMATIIIALLAYLAFLATLHFFRGSPSVHVVSSNKTPKKGNPILRAKKKIEYYQALYKTFFLAFKDLERFFNVLLSFFFRHNILIVRVMRDSQTASGGLTISGTMFWRELRSKSFFEIPYLRYTTGKFRASGAIRDFGFYLMVFKYKGTWFLATTRGESSQRDNVVVEYSKHITCIYSLSKDDFAKESLMLELGFGKTKSLKDKGLVSTCYSDGKKWIASGHKPFVRLSDLNYNEGLVDHLCSYLDSFKSGIVDEEYPTLKNKSLVICLDGEPGNGKSTLVKSLCGEYGLSYYAFSSPKISDAEFTALMSTPRSSVAFIFEDCDDMFPQKRDLDSDGVDYRSDAENRISLTTLLNVLQGSLSGPCPRIIFMTTNKKRALDDAILREGRVTTQVTMLNPTVKTSAKIIDSFLDCGEEESFRIAQEINPDQRMTYAALEGWCERKVRGDGRTCCVSF